LVEVDSIGALQDIEPYVQLLLPKLPPDILYRAWKFFNAAYNKFKSESAVVIHYNKDDGEYYLHCPEQTVSHGSVNYDLDDRFENYQLVGTIHSHADFNAFHSGTDIDDEVDQDGVHITLGHVDGKYFSASACLVVNGTRFETALENTGLGVRRVTMKDGDPNISAGRADRYMVSLSDEEKAAVDAAYDQEIKDWVKDKVSGRQTGFNRGSVVSYPSTTPASNGNSSGVSSTSTRNESTFVHRLDPKGSGRKGWFNQNGDELNPSDNETSAEKPENETSEQPENWDAEAVLAENDLLEGAELPKADDDVVDLTIADDSSEESSDDVPAGVADHLDEKEEPTIGQKDS